MEWLLYMIVSALLLKGLAKEVEADDVISFIALLLGYVIVVACMPLIMFIS